MTGTDDCTEGVTTLHDPDETSIEGDIGSIDSHDIGTYCEDETSLVTETGDCNEGVTTVHDPDETSTEGDIGSIDPRDIGTYCEDEKSSEADNGSDDSVDIGIGRSLRRLGVDNTTDSDVQVSMIFG